MILVLLFVETLPKSLPATSTTYPKYVTALSNLPDDGGVLDLEAPSKYMQLYYQTEYRKPLAFGYVARTPSSVAEKEKRITRAINRGNYSTMWEEYNIRYIATKDMIEYDDPCVFLELVYWDDDTNIYRLECVCENEE